MSEEKEDSDQPDIHEKPTYFRTQMSKDTLIRFRRKAKQRNLAMSSFIRNAIEKFLQEDERIQFLVEESSLKGNWRSWEEYRKKQVEEDQEQFDKFTDEEIESIFEELQKQREEEDELL